MPPPPPRPAPARSGGPASGPASGASVGSASRSKEVDNKAQAGTYFLGRYRVVDEIGVGGMASVHLARMDGPGGFQKWVAIKRIHPHLVEDDQFVDMFLDEARIAAGINHANVAQVFDLGKDDNTYWIAMEYLHGEPLREVMRRAEDRGQRIAPELAARICADAAEGLHAAHELRGKNGQLLGLVHRDVTPHNLFVTYDGYTKVVDFGIAKVADRLSSTRAGTLKGKLAYMSPEQVRGAEVDRTTDIFALGVVLWEITTNQRLFRMDTDLDTLEKVQACVVPPPSTLVPGYPPELEACVMKALSKRKQDRYPTAREFSRALQQSLVRTGQFVGPEEVAQFVRSVFVDRIKKREEHLAWAAEVTGTLNIDQLRKKQNATTDPPGPVTPPGPAAPPISGPRPAPLAPKMNGAPPPAQSPGPSASMDSSGHAGAPPLAQLSPNSLMDDDEDVPTTVATRETMDIIASVMKNAAAGGMPPPATASAPNGFPGGPSASQVPHGGPSPASYAANAASFGASAASYAANVGRVGGAGGPQGYPAPGAPGSMGGGGHIADLGSTVALPSTLALEGGPPRSGFGAQPAAWGPAANGPGGYPSPNGPAPTFGPPPANPAFSPVGVVAGLPVLPQTPPGQASPQSQIETAISLPRPDPAALWAAQQERQKGERRNVLVLVAVVALTALCVLGIGALIFFKLRSRAHVEAEANPAVSASAPVVGVAGTASGAAPPASASAAPQK